MNSFCLWVSGWAAFAAMDQLFQGNYIFAAIDIGLSLVNLWMGMKK